MNKALESAPKIRKPIPYRVHYATVAHAAICGRRGSDYASSPFQRSVSCPKCLEVMTNRGLLS